MKTFRPIKAPNTQVPGKTIKEQAENLPLPLIASYKLDGIRCIFKEGNMYSCSLKNIPNEKLHERFALLKRFSKDNDVILDGELYAPSIPFNELSGVCRRLSSELPNDLSFYCFDYLQTSHGQEDSPFFERKINLIYTEDKIGCEYFKVVDQISLNTAEEVVSYFNEAIAFGCDGLILRDPEGQYKYGRASLREGLIFKLKPYRSFEGKVIGIIQATKVNPLAKKKINKLGYSETSKKKKDRILIESSCAILVLHEGFSLKVMLAMTDKEKREIWRNRARYVGRWAEYKGLEIGMKDLPRHPVWLRWRDDKN